MIWVNFHALQTTYLTSFYISFKTPPKYGFNASMASCDDVNRYPSRLFLTFGNKKTQFGAKSELYSG